MQNTWTNLIFWPIKMHPNFLPDPEALGDFTTKPHSSRQDPFAIGPRVINPTARTRIRFICFSLFRRRWNHKHLLSSCFSLSLSRPHSSLFCAARIEIWWFSTFSRFPPILFFFVLIFLADYRSQSFILLLCCDFDCCFGSLSIPILWEKQRIPSLVEPIWFRFVNSLTTIFVYW